MTHDVTAKNAPETQPASCGAKLPMRAAHATARTGQDGSGPWGGRGISGGPLPASQVRGRHVNTIRVRRLFG